MSQIDLQKLTKKNQEFVHIATQQFIKDGKSLFDGLLSYKTKNGYVNTKGERKRNVGATEKALLALTSMKLQKMGLKLFELEK